MPVSAFSSARNIVRVGHAFPARIRRTTALASSAALLLLVAACAEEPTTPRLPLPTVGGVSFDVVTGPVVSILKTAVAGTVLLGDSAQFDVTVSNTGDAPAIVSTTDWIPWYGAWFTRNDPDGKCNLVVSGSVPGIVCQGIELPAKTGATTPSYTVRLSIKTTTAMCAGPINNTASLGGYYSSPYSGSSSASITVDCSAASLLAALRADLNTSALNRENLRHPLTVKLDKAIKELTAGKMKSACNALADFADQVEAQRGKGISIAIADTWIAKIAVIRTAAGC